MAKGAAHAIRLSALLASQALRFPRQLIDLSGSLLLVQSPEKIGRFAKPVGGPASVGITLPLLPLLPLLWRGSAAHVVVGLAQAIESLLRA